MHHIVVIGTVVVLFAAGFALFSLFEEEKKVLNRPHSRRRSPPRHRTPSPPRRRSSPPRRKPVSPPPRSSSQIPLCGPNPTSSDHPESPPDIQPPTRPLSPHSPNSTSSDHPESPPSTLSNALRRRQTSNGNHASNAIDAKESSSRHEDALVASGSQDTSVSQNENDSSRCYHASKCTNCVSESGDLVTFSPCGCSYFCRRCAMKYLERYEDCCLCQERITNMEF